MKNQKRIWFALMLVAGFITGCGPEPEARVSNIPIYQGASATPQPTVSGKETPTPLPTPTPDIATEAQKKPFEKWLETFETAAKDEGFDLEYEVYNFNKKIEWRDVQAYYLTSIRGDWKRDTHFDFSATTKTSEKETLHLMGWRNSTAQYEQSLIIGMLLDEAGDKFLLIAILTGK